LAVLERHCLPWLWAKKNKSNFVLRIEDTDRERSTQASVEAILVGLEWLGLDYDEGPVYQSDRFGRYNEAIQELLSSGQAYYLRLLKRAPRVNERGSN
jgi:glutamyl-tRNA synthetase